MPRLTDWTWWVGHRESVEAEGTYDIDECDTREQAIAAGKRECAPGEQFCIVEARMWDRESEPPNPDHVPFARTRNAEVITA